MWNCDCCRFCFCNHLVHWFACGRTDIQSPPTCSKAIPFSGNKTKRTSVAVPDALIFNEQKHAPQKKKHTQKRGQVLNISSHLGPSHANPYRQPEASIKLARGSNSWGCFFPYWGAFRRSETKDGDYMWAVSRCVCVGEVQGIQFQTRGRKMCNSPPAR